MRRLIRLAGGVMVVMMLSLMALPSLLVDAVTSRIGEVSALVAEWDIPPQSVPVFEDAGRVAGVPWFLLAGAASVATDFGRHGPDGVVRGAIIGSSIFPVLDPPLTGSSGGKGVFLVDPAATSPGEDLQDVRISARWLADALTQAGGRLSHVPAAGFWVRAIASLGLRISAIAPRRADLPGPPAPGNDPIRLFGKELLGGIGAPVTSDNLDAIAAWAAGEGSCAAFNPLDTTQPEAGASPFNTLPGGGHVWNYPTFESGVRATVETLLNGLYRPVISALQSRAGLAAIAAAVRDSRWGTGAFGSPSFAGRRCGPFDPALPPAALPAVLDAEVIATTVVARAARYQAIWEQSIGAG